MNIINVDLSNIDQEHVCCSISVKKGESCLKNRKNWMSDQFQDGLTFKKLDINGKVLIEYMLPAENAWCFNGTFVTNEILSESKFLKMIRGKD